MARVNVEHRALTDQRFELLGKLLGSNRHEALGRMLLVWHECQEQGSYTLPEKRVNIIMSDTRGAEFMIDADLAERVEGGVRIKGTEGRIEWLQEKRETGKQFGHLGAKHGSKGGRPKKGVETGSRGFSKPGEGVSETGSPGFQNPPPPPAPTPAKTEDPTGGAASPPAEPRDASLATTEKPKRKEATGPQAEFIRCFVGAWKDRYPNVKYPFDGKDAKFIEWFREQFENDVARFQVVVARYMACDEPFFNGHPMSHLRNQLPKFLVAPRSPPRRGGNFQTADDRWSEMMFGNDQPGEAA